MATNTNLFSHDLTPESVAKIREHLAGIRAELPFLRSIPEGDANRLRKQHLDGAELIGKAGRAVAQLPDVMPGLFAKADFVRDAALLEPVLAVRGEIKSLYEELDDTARLLHDETSGQQTKVYGAFKAAAKDNAAARTLFEDMEKHHKKGGGNTPPPKA